MTNGKKTSKNKGKSSRKSADFMEKLKQFGSQTPLERPGQPAELASIYVQLAANDASYSTGQIYGASGGEGNP